MVRVLLLLAVLLIGSGCGRAEVEALMAEVRDLHAATIADLVVLAAGAAEQGAAEQGAAHVARAEDRAARGEPVVTDAETLAGRAVAAADWEAQLAATRTAPISTLTTLEDAAARGAWDVHFPDAAGAGLTPRGIVAEVRDAVRFDRDRMRARVERRDSSHP